MVFVGLDTERVVIDAPDGDAAAEAEIARLYQAGRVVRHEVVDGRVVVEADVPRRAKIA
jgi:predicted nuclease with RNAse H fold